MRLLLHRGEHFRERAQLVRRKSSGDGLLERIEVTMNARGNLTSARRQLDDERSPIGRADVTGDEPAVGEAIENARERRALVRETPVQGRNRRRTGRRKLRQDMRLALRQPELSDVETDPVCRSVNRRNEAQGHRL